MALTIGEASAVNLVLRELLGQRSAAATAHQVGAAAALLADHAHKTLSAGLRGDDVLASDWAAKEGLR
ncbi:hypothetical protein ABFU82_22420 [Nocardioides sp. WV_118_6]